VIAATVLGSGLAALDATVVGIALPAIGRDTGAGLGTLQWVVTAYTLTLAGLLLLGGALGVSRVVTSLGWRPHHEQVGQTGSKVSPQLYIACGISGAIQHWVGMSSAQTILAVNNDAEAPMVTKAHYAVIGDLHEVVPAINAEIKRRQA